MHLVIYFCGTGNPGNDFINYNNYLNHPNIGIIFVKGCHVPEVCNSGLFPNIKKFAARFVNHIFKKDTSENKNNVLTVNTDDFVSLGVDPIQCLNIDPTKPIESITLCGYSRGSVTCFAVAKELNKISPQTSVDIIGNQSVPGNSYVLPFSNAKNIADCSNLNNLNKVSIILGAYTGTTYSDGDQHSTPSTSKIHRGFFSQIVPKLPKKTNKEIIVIPSESHHQQLINSPSGTEHMHMQIAKHLHQRDEKLIDKKTVNIKTAVAAYTYKNWHDASTTLFPQEKKLQPIFGLSRWEAYKHLDKLHPTPELRAGSEVNFEEKMIKWWNKHNNSSFSTQITKNLVTQIKKTDATDPDSLQKLYQQTEEWLMKKEGSSSSRYNQVRALRANLYYQLVNEHKIEKSTLMSSTCKTLTKTNYFLNHWNLRSSEASFFKTAATRQLDKAFLTHNNAPASKENNQILLNELNHWLTLKKDSNSSRLQLVTSIRNTLVRVIGQEEKENKNNFRRSI